MLRLEPLEGRLAPAALTVNGSFDDTTTDSLLSLREAVLLVNNGGNATAALGRSLTAGEQAQVNTTQPFGSTDTIQFDPSLPVGTMTLTHGALNITSPVTINGPGAGKLTISGNDADRVFLIGQIWTPNLSLAVALNDLTIAGGNVVSSSNSYGGGLVNSGKLTVTNCTFANNKAGSGGGGGIANTGDLTLNGCTFTSNTAAGYGGGLRSFASGTLTVTNCKFIGNTTSGFYNYGGGLINSSATPSSVSDSTFSGNSATGSGGGLFNDTGATLTVHNCTFDGNISGADGGGLDHDGQSLTVTDSTFSNNTATGDGGGLQNWKAQLTVRNSTFYGNTASSNGGGLTIAGPATTVVNCTITANHATGSSGGGLYIDNANGTGTVFNTVVAGNFTGTGTTPSDISGNLDTTSAYNLIGTGGSGGLSNRTNGNQVGVSDPGLGSLADNGGPTRTVALLSKSPAIDKGSNAYVNTGETDQRGFTRIVNRTVDIGAFEVQTAANAQPPIINSPSANPGIVTGTTTTLTAMATDPNGGSLTYTWSVVSGPAGVTFGKNNGTTSGNNVTATFSMAGSYTFQVTVTDSFGASSTQTVNVTVQQTLTSVAVSPAKANIPLGGTAQFTATALDQFGNSIQTSFTTWTIVSGLGTIDPNGLYTSNGSGTAVIQAQTTVNGTTISATATVTVRKH